MSKDHIVIIDYLRIIAFLLVYLFHTGFLYFGWIGVDLFFLISGFLMWRLYSTREVRVLTFYLKRFWRLVPATVAVVLAFVLFMHIFVGGSSYDNAIESAIATNLYMNNLLLIAKSSDYWGLNALYDGLIHTWSLGVEEQFYLLFPLLLLFRKKMSLWMYIAVISMSFFFAMEMSYYNPLGKVWLFLLGIVVSEYLMNWKWKSSFLILSVLLVLGGFIEWSIIALGTYLLAISEYGILGFNRIVKYVADLTYSLYLVHVPVLVGLRYFFGELNLIENFTALMMSVILSVLLHETVESWFRGWYLKPNQTLRVGVLIGFPLIFLVSLYSLSDSSAIEYNMRFTDRADLMDSKVIIYGDSKARDFGNVLLEMCSGVSLGYVDYRDSVKLRELNDNVIIFIAMNEIKNIPHSALEDSRSFYVKDKSFPMTFAMSKISKEDFFRDVPIDELREAKAQSMVERGYTLVDPYHYLYYEDLSLLSVAGQYLSEDGIHLTKYGAEWIANMNSDNQMIVDILNECISEGEPSDAPSNAHQ